MAMNRQELATVNRILARANRSLLQYLGGVGAWASSAEGSTLAALQRLIAEEQEACTALATWLTKQRVIPDKGAFPMEFCSAHYLALDHLLPWLVRYQQWLIAAQERDLATLKDAELHAAAQPLVDLNRQHLPELQALASRYDNNKLASTLV